MLRVLVSTCPLLLSVLTAHVSNESTMRRDCTDDHLNKNCFMLSKIPRPYWSTASSATDTARPYGCIALRTKIMQLAA
jgi:hypothetical protein